MGNHGLVFSSSDGLREVNGAHPPLGFQVYPHPGAQGCRTNSQTERTAFSPGKVRWMGVGKGGLASGWESNYTPSAT